MPVAPLLYHPELYPRACSSLVHAVSNARAVLLLAVVRAYDSMSKYSTAPGPNPSAAARLTASSASLVPSAPGETIRAQVPQLPFETWRPT
jgi:hypothetical protein